MIEDHLMLKPEEEWPVVDHQGWEGKTIAPPFAHRR